jgi:hypothetical protein
MGDSMQNLLVSPGYCGHKVAENWTPHSNNMFMKNAMAHAAEIAAILIQILL